MALVDRIMDVANILQEQFAQLVKNPKVILDEDWILESDLALSVMEQVATAVSALVAPSADVIDTLVAEVMTRCNTLM